MQYFERYCDNTFERQFGGMTLLILVTLVLFSLLMRSDEKASVDLKTLGSSQVEKLSRMRVI